MSSPSSNANTSTMVDESAATNSSWKRYLPSDYQLREMDVICGRGTTCFNHIGNARFRHVIESHLNRYLNTTSKLDKTMLIYEIVNFIRSSGDFVKLDKMTSQYYEVGDYHAREKTSQGFRDALHEHYKSSNAKKRIKRKILKSQKAVLKASIELPDSTRTSGQSLAIVSPSSSETSLINNADAAYMSQRVMMNATFASLAPTKTSTNVLDRLPMNKFLHAAQDNATPTSTSIDNNAISNFNDERFALQSLIHSDSRRLSLTTSFMPLDDYLSYESSCDMTAGQRHPSLILDELEETMIMQDDWNNAVMPTDVFSGDNNFSNDRPLLFQSLGLHFDTDFKQLLKSFL